MPRRHSKTLFTGRFFLFALTALMGLTACLLSGNSVAASAVQLPDYPLNGRVTDINGNGLSEVTITVSGAPDGAVATSQTDANGNYSFNNSVAGDTLVASKTGYTFNPSLIRAVSSQGYTPITGTFNFTGATAFYTLSGQVIDGTGAGLQGAQVSLSGSMQAVVPVDANGNYSIPGLFAGGNYTVTPSKAGYFFNPSGVIFNNLSSNRVVRTFVGTTHPYSITGQVKDVSGNPLGAVLVTLSRTGGSETIITQTDPGGNYTFRNVASEATYTVTPAKAGLTFTPQSATFTNPSGNQIANFTGNLFEGIFFGAASYSLAEGAGSIAIIVNRSGDLSSAASVNYTTSDASAFLQNCHVVNGAATSRCDYVSLVGTLHFAANENSKTLFLPIIDDTYPEGPETLKITLSKPSGGAVLSTNPSATITITDNNNDGTSQSNPIDGTNFFVRQHYIDFLGREPDPASTGWIEQINQCVLIQPNCDRLSVSQGIYNSPEFKDRGYFIYKFYSVAFGRKPSYDEFVLDRARVSGFQTEAELEQSKLDFIADFMSRPEFAAYNGLTNDQYVQTLFNMVGLTQITVNGAVRNVAALQQQMAGGRTRAQVLRDIAESPEVSNKFLVESTIVMHYFGYLRRDPDASYQDWINIYNQTGDSRNVTNGFVNSAEYRARFSQ
ncbi:MAG TPA: carboxypeptidase regulatory-like domain-containing protein [Pyrinomonadaceae bacterium]|jgi:hypothetical protein|nr:carboxypeptidase regulatory-like domain-containing protein [Pyrinomonadaceae bacterium]